MSDQHTSSEQREDAATSYSPLDTKLIARREQIEQSMDELGPRQFRETAWQYRRKLVAVTAVCPGE